jgi:ADP-ribose pyrophosphatase YjhB (NUDIX family)
MKEYGVEHGKFDLKVLEASQLSREAYVEAHKGMVISCHDVFIKYKGGLLLIKRNNLPAKDIPWMIGGRINRGVNTKKSLEQKTFEECGLRLKNIRELGFARTYFETDPFGHGKGTDTFNIVYFAEGEGELKLDKLHEEPTIILPEDYTEEFRKILHPYVRDFMDLAMPFLG